MNKLKYQEALDNLIKISCPKKTSCNKCKIRKVCNCEAKVYIDTLQELVDKATPQKPCLWGDGYDEKGELIYDMYDCPRCDKSYELDYHKTTRCDNCGQVFDWEEVE